jgi:hypothetical protein
MEHEEKPMNAITELKRPTVDGFELPVMDKSAAIRQLGEMSRKLEALVPEYKKKRWRPSEKAMTIASTLESIAAIRMAAAALIAQGDD